MTASDVVHGEDRKRAAVRTGARAGSTQPPPAFLEFPMLFAFPPITPRTGAITSDNVYVNRTSLSTNTATCSSSPGHAALPPHHTLTRCTLVTCWSMMVHDPRKRSAGSASASFASAS